MYQLKEVFYVLLKEFMILLALSNLKKLNLKFCFKRYVQPILLGMIISLKIQRKNDIIFDVKRNERVNIQRCYYLHDVSESMLAILLRKMKLIVFQTHPK